MVIIILTHLLIDIWKSYRPDTITFYLLDHLFHLSVILLVWGGFYFNCKEISDLLTHYFISPHFWVIILSYYLVTGPMGLIIGKATEKWQQDAKMDTDGLNKAGIWIGRCERILVLTFILLSQFTALGFLMAAKSILRFSDKEERHQKKTEYILVGTLISFVSAALVGEIAHYILIAW